jgi:hypothetical protein
MMRQAHQRIGDLRILVPADETDRPDSAAHEYSCEVPGNFYHFAPAQPIAGPVDS